MANLEMKVSVTDIEEVKNIIINCATFAYTENVSVSDFKAQTRYLLEQIGVTPETYFLGYSGGGDNATT